ncbi:MAG: hypothetical protein RLZZ324_1029 [Candidatus Parcubacteria bacterium]|jgi:hypothetical protein
MNKGDVIRSIVTEVLAQGGGTARTSDFRVALTAAGYAGEKMNVAFHLRPLITRKKIARVGKDTYRDTTVSEGVMARLPYGVRTEGRILRYMITHRHVRAGEVIAHLRAAGLVKHRTLAYTALWRLRKDGYVFRVANGTYTLTRKTLSLVSMQDVCDPTKARTFFGPWGAIIMPHIVELLGVMGPMSPTELAAHLNRRGFPVRREQVFSAIRTLLRRGEVRKQAYGAYASAKMSDDARSAACGAI